jgi:tetratricopeptide (TPR) repeat protein
VSREFEEPTSVTRWTTGAAVSDRALNRAIAVLIAILMVGIPGIALVYYLDRHVDAGPSIQERTVQAAEDAVRANPNLLSARIALAQAYADSGRNDDAVSQYGIVLGAEPGNLDALVGRAEANRSLGQLDAAAADFQMVVDATKGEEMANVNPQLEASYYGLGAIALAQDRPRDAATLLANAILIDRTDADALALMGEALIDIPDYESAAGALSDAVALVPTGWCEPYQLLQQAYEGMGETTGATYASGMFAFCQGRTDDAHQLLASVSDGPFLNRALIGQGLMAEYEGDRDAAIAFYTRVYDGDPTNFLAVSGLNRLGAVVSPVPSESAAPAATGGN